MSGKRIRFIQVFILFSILVAALMSTEIIGYRVDRNSCIGCRQCETICPTKAISIEDGKAVIDPELCISCGLCANVCPTGCISPIEGKSDTFFSEPPPPRVPSSVSPVVNSESIAVTTDRVKEIYADRVDRIKLSHKEERDTSQSKGEIPVLDPEKCISCGICVTGCPENAIELIDGKPVIDPQKCSSCGICVERCPVGALSMPSRD